MNPAHADGVVTDARPAVGLLPGKALALIVDDSPFLALHLCRLLQAQGFQVRVPAEAAELGALAESAAVIFVELELFQGSGFAVTRELAARCSCPLVLLTGTGRTTDRQWGLRAGARAVLPRPVTAAALEQLLHALGCAEKC
jgi:DNA-binding response OmpR family regulator